MNETAVKLRGERLDGYGEIPAIRKEYREKVTVPTKNAKKLRDLGRVVGDLQTNFKYTKYFFLEIRRRWKEKHKKWEA